MLREYEMYMLGRIIGESCKTSLALNRYWSSICFADLVERHADLVFCHSCCILVKLRLTDRHRKVLHNWRIRLVVYGARLESVLV